MAKTQPVSAESDIDDATADADADADADAEALADLRAGRTVSHDRVKAWLRSWGEPDEHPPPTIPGDSH
jgi:predicted transcriptional regulator